MKELGSQVPKLLDRAHIVFEDVFGEEETLLYGKYRNWMKINKFVRDRVENSPGQHYVAKEQFRLYDYQGIKIGKQQWRELVPNSKVTMSIIMKLPGHNTCGRCFKVEHGIKPGTRITWYIIMFEFLLIIS
jgi:hypothetical protein